MYGKDIEEMSRNLLALALIAIILGTLYFVIDFKFLGSSSETTVIYLRAISILVNVSLIVAFLLTLTHGIKMGLGLEANQLLMR